MGRMLLDRGVSLWASGVQEARAQESVEDASARSAFVRADQARQFFGLELGPSPSVGSIGDAVARAPQQVVQDTERYSAVLQYRSPRWTVAALVAEAQLYELFASSLAALTADARRVGGSTNARTESDRLRRSLARLRETFECHAIARYRMALVTANSSALASPAVDLAADAVRRFGRARAEACPADRELPR